jgi:hypothetical protein
LLEQRNSADNHDYGRVDDHDDLQCSSNDDFDLDHDIDFDLDHDVHYPASCNCRLHRWSAEARFFAGYGCRRNDLQPSGGLEHLDDGVLPRGEAVCQLDRSCARCQAGGTADKGSNHGRGRYILDRSVPVDAAPQ